MREGTSGGFPSLGRDRCSWGTHEDRSRRETANAQGQRGSRVPCLFCVRRKRDLEHSQLTKLLFNLAESSIPRFRRVVCAEIVTNEFFEESCGKYMRFRVFSARSCRCLQRRSTRKTRPSRCRRVHHASFVEKASARSTRHE